MTGRDDLVHPCRFFFSGPESTRQVKSRRAEQWQACAKRSFPAFVHSDHPSPEERRKTHTLKAQLKKQSGNPSKGKHATLFSGLFIEVDDRASHQQDQFVVQARLRRRRVSGTPSARVARVPAPGMRTSRDWS